MNPLRSTSKNWEKSKTIWLVALFVLYGASDVFGQVANYTFSESAGTYTSAAGTTVHASGWDDAVSANTIPLGFTFVFNGTNYTTCSISTNGFLTFGGTVAGTTEYTPISSGTGYSGAISAIGFDLISNASTITYTTTGAAPNRTFIAQWNNARRYSGATINGDFNFQIRLNETTNVINIVYGSCTPATNTNYNVQVGLRGASNADFNNRSFASNAIWDNSTTAGGANNATCRTRSTAYPTSGRTFTWTPLPVPTITSFTPSSACASSSQTVVITGTNFTGATAVTIGGTAAASYVVNSATQITATIGTGTTGTVQVTTPGGTATSGATFTVNPLPANPGNPTSNSPQCNPPGVTLTRAGSPPAGVTWYWQTTALGTSTVNSGATFVVTTSGTYYLRAQNDTSGCWSTGSGSVTVVVNNAPTITTNPVNSTINVGTNTSFTVAGSNTPTSYTWQVSTDGGFSWTTISNGGVYSNATTATLNITGATIGMSGYMYHASATNACGTSTYSTNATLTVTLAYCTPSFTSSVEPISNVTFNTINNTSGNTCGAGTSYENFTGTSTSVFRGFTYNLSATGNTCGNFTNYIYAYVDWNQDGDFADAGESYNLGTINNTTAGVLTQAITIPVGASLGSTRMRIIKNFNTAPTDPCRTGTGYGQAEDYTITVVAPPACTTPTAQPTALGLTPSGTSIAGTFTAASPASDSYLVVISTSATPPSAPVNGTTYAIGSSLASGYIVVDNDSNTTFTAGGLNISTTYYFYIFSFNGLCTGGPLYNATSPLTGNATTTAVAPTYCAPSSVSASVYISSLRSVGTIADVTNGPTGYSAGGYGNFSATTIATQVAGSGINLEIVVTGSYGTGMGCPSTSQFIKTWVDWNKDGDFDDAGEQVYVSGTDLAPVATALDNIYGFVVPPGTFPGNYRMRVRTRAYCDSAILLPCATGYATGETEDYTIAIIEDCPSKILTVTNGSACGPTNTVTLGATKTASATGFRWYANLTGGAPLATTVAGSWTTPSISATTTYYVTAYDGVCETIHRTPVVATILPTSNITVTPSVPEVCGEGNVVQITASGDFVTETLLLQTFESGMAPFTVTTPTNTNGGADTPWSVKTSVYVPAATSVWRPALNSGAIGTTGNNFAFTTSDYNNSNIQTIMTSPVINASLYTTLNLTFDQMYGAFSGDSAIVQAYDGTTWTTVANYTATDIGTPSVFTKMGPINLNAYAGNANLQIRFVYTAQWDDGWAVDNIKVEGVRPLNTTFTWTGGSVNAFTDPGLTTPYVAQSVSTVYVVPTAMQLAATSWSFTANATLGNGCPISQLITINNKTKLWKGTVDNNWYNGANWEPAGVPDATTCVFIYDGPFDSNINNTGNDAYARTLTVRPSGLLEIQANNDLTVTNTVTVDAGGTFNIENNGSLIQVNNVANSGSINSKRIAVTNSYLDYVYWSTPVAGFNVNSITPSSSNKYFWNPTVNNGGTYSGNFGNWVAASGAMTTGRGYIVRGSSGNTTFAGVPNNGNITIPITRGTYTSLTNYTGPTATPVTRDDDNWNLLGNPYPSALSADAFLTANLTNLSPFVKIWRHGIDPATISDPFYQDYQLNYNTSDYLTYNRLGGTQSGFDGYIGSGQGFFVLMTDAGATTENAIFNNTMRSNAFRNNQFYRTGEGIERHRIWLKIISPTRASNDMLVGYTSEATNEFDSVFDTKYVGVKTNFELYSLIDNDGYIIQGRALPFNNNDEIPLGVSVPQNGIYVIAIDAVDGLFNSTSQEIFIEDKTLGTTHNLRSSPYSFTANTGRFDNRFVLKFKNETLSNEDFTANSIMVYANESINVVANNQTIKSVRVHDLLGRVLGTFNNVNSSTFETKNIAKTQSALLVEVTLDNGLTKTYKVIF